MLDRRGTLRVGAERRAFRILGSGLGSTTPAGDRGSSSGLHVSQRPFDVDGAMTIPNRRIQRNKGSFLLNTTLSEDGDAAQCSFRSESFQECEAFLTSETTYVAQLREELWQALAAHVVARTLTQVDAALDCLEQIECFWGQEGLDDVENVRVQLRDGKFDAACSTISRVVASMSSVTGSMHGRRHSFYVLVLVPPCVFRNTDFRLNLAYELRRISQTEATDACLDYKIVEVDSWKRALLGVIINPEILAVCVQDNVPLESIGLTGSSSALSNLEGFVRGLERFVDGPLRKIKSGAPLLPTLIRSIKRCRRSIDIFCVCSGMGLSSLDNVGSLVKRAFFPNDDHADLHEAILEGVKSKMRCPFFEALRSYAERPIGVFHALAVSRGNSLRRSKWIDFLLDFYGTALFKAESSATCGGLDSLLDPHGSLLEAQNLAARAYDASYAFFVTNGTSTSNKIVVQALVRPGDVVLIDRDCHKSHHYGLVVGGARPCYLDAYPMHAFSMYGGVTLRDIKKALLGYRIVGRLHEVKLLVVTNCTFDGIVYNVRRLIEECLAIKPDLIFLFDEAWFAYAGFHPILKTRTAMHCANELRRHLTESRYAGLHRNVLESLGVSDLSQATPSQLLNTRLYPDPARARVRVYATQSTHKSLTALRQGSMVLVNDDLFESDVHTAFKESYFTHMSTSPNYQILATLDVGRSQMELEGYGLVERQLEAALIIRNSLARDPLVKKYFRVLGPRDMIPAHLRTSSQNKATTTVSAVEVPTETQCFESVLTSGEHENEINVHTIEKQWLSDDEFVLDPTRITLFTGFSGLDGDTFKVKWLMDKYGIQVNKTSRSSVLFMTNIGTTRSSCVFLRSCIRHCAQELEMHRLLSSRRELDEHQQRIEQLVVQTPPLPSFSGFHPLFERRKKHIWHVNTSNAPDVCDTGADSIKAYAVGWEQPFDPETGTDIRDEKVNGVALEGVPEHIRVGGKGTVGDPMEDMVSAVRDGDMREPFYLAYSEDVVEYFSLADALKLIRNGRTLVGSTFLIPYPPGFPISVPGQILSADIVEFLIKLDVKEIHGFDPKLGLRCFKESVLRQMMANEGLIGNEKQGEHRKVSSKIPHEDTSDAGESWSKDHVDAPAATTQSDLQRGKHDDYY